MSTLTLPPLATSSDELSKQLQEELGFQVSFVSTCSKEVDCERIQRAIESNGVPVFEYHGDKADVAIAISDHEIATWQTDKAYAVPSARHAQALIALHAAQLERNQLNQEVESLAIQVMNDFEELALIRSLAHYVALPSSTNQAEDFILRTLNPLANGVGASAVVGVFTDEDETSRHAPIWTSQPVLGDSQLNHLIDEHRAEAQTRPVVRNGLNLQSDSHDAVLNEFVLLQCHSEGRLHGWIIACNRVDDEEDVPWAQRGYTTVQAALLETATNQLAAQLHNVRLLKQKESLFTEVVRALVNAVEARDPYTCGHSERVALFGRCLATLNGQPADDIDRIYLTGLLHDVGKIAIPDGVLQKPGRLDDDERAIIETHTDAGWRILHELDALQGILPGVLHHHEHFNGKGYPDGLVGEAIPIDGRILAVCDAFDAMTSDRPYRKGMPIEKAANILKEGSGGFWDPNLIEIFIENLDQFDEIRRNHKPRQQATRVPTQATP